MKVGEYAEFKMAVSFDSFDHKLAEKLEAFKVKAAGAEKQENRKEKGKEIAM